MAGSSFMTAADVIGLLDGVDGLQDGENGFTEDDGFDDIMFPGSDDELGFGEVEIRHSDSDSEEEQNMDV